jgi:hypothetical protein
MLIAIINQSKAVTNTDVATMTAAIATQVQNDVAPVWGRPPAEVVFYADPTAVPPASYGVAVVDTIPDQPQGVLGFHTEAQAAQMWGVVAAQSQLDNGGKVLTDDWSVSSTLSHEVLEMFVDPNCNLWANDGNGSLYSLEVCDPVEAPTYTVNNVSVSNFVTPSWFDPQTPATAQTDKTGQVTGPFTVAAGGYVNYVHGGQFTVAAGGYETYVRGGSQMQQQFGTTYPGWRKTMKSPGTAGPMARSQRILGLWHT